MQLVWFRILFTLAGLGIYFFFTGADLKVKKKDALILLVIGGVIALHWFLFYHAIKLSNVSVTLVAFSTGTLFTSIFEPLFYKRKPRIYEIVFGLVIILAILLIMTLDAHYIAGMILGMLAALTSSLFTVWNGLLVRRLGSAPITFIELSGGFLFLSIFLFFSQTFEAAFFHLSIRDGLLLILFSLVGTAFPFVASVDLLKRLSPFTVTLTVNLETVYGIIFSFLLWPETETMKGGFYLGTGLILMVIIVNAIVKSRL